MDETQVKEQLSRVKEIKLQINNIKKDLNKLNRFKESWYSKKSKFNKEISSKISAIKGSKTERNEITNQVQAMKIERDKLNKELAEKRTLLSKHKEAYDSKISKLKIDGNPEDFRKQIERMEYSLETNVMSFKKEQEINKEIKTLKKQLKGFDEVKGDWGNVKELSNEVRRLRKDSNEVHKKIQTFASDSQDKHVVVIGQSKEIDDIKVKEEEAFKKFKEFKEQFTEKNDKLKALVKEFEELKVILEEQDIKIEEDKKELAAKAIKEKAKEVNEKMKTGKKLTTEDFLVFQRAGKK